MLIFFKQNKLKKIIEKLTCELLVEILKIMSYFQTIPSYIPYSFKRNKQKR